MITFSGNVTLHEGSLVNFIRYSGAEEMDEAEAALIAAFLQSEDYARALENKADVIAAFEAFEKKNGILQTESCSPS